MARTTRHDGASRTVRFESRMSRLAALSSVAVVVTLASGCDPGWSSHDARHFAAEATVAEAVFRPELPPTLDPHDGEVASILERLELPEGHSLSNLVHGLHLFGGGLMVRVPVGGSRGGASRFETVAALAVILDFEWGESYFPGAAPLARTRHGIRPPLVNRGLLSTDQSVTEAHPGQLLAVMAECGVPLTQTVKLKDGSGTVGDILEDTIANFSLDSSREIEWDAVALAIYHPRPRWTNKWQAAFTFDELATSLIERAVSVERVGACGGTHALIALTVILRVDRIRTIVSGETRQRIHDTLMETAAILARTQHPDGSWGYDWNVRESVPARTPFGSDSFEALLVTGHHLEWLLLMPDQAVSKHGMIRPAGLWLLNALRARTADAEHVADMYCPLVHAAKAVRILCNGEF